MILDSSSQGPLLSMVLTTHNQGRLAVAALESLFAQTYSPIEIIVADDCSSNGTAEMISACVESHKSLWRGRVVVINNSRNLGVARNTENAFLQAKGGLIVLCGGDDISYPDRAATIARRWIENGCKATVIFHDFRPIDLKGVPTGQVWWKRSIEHPIGAAMAFSRDVVLKFPAITETAGFEDCIFARRAYALGDSLHLNDVLVDYRVGSGVTTTGDFLSKRGKIISAMIASAKQGIIDMNSIEFNVDAERRMEILERARIMERQYEAERDLVSGKTVFNRICGLVRYYKVSDGAINCVSLFSNYLPIVFPALSPVVNIIRKLKRSVFTL